ncbi:MAG: 30S ribosomal protein S19 [Candidatus Terrybacteria bacterium RIFCSPLOWO2_01_FULL_44_24]|uniref:Small ribosomal subunit protein uS19 n=1 Tax=Candidatus Terrybacteria bacterium RIFCSPHIGHO2_01_FULL_43_35 TaxID=1802361 RepID=A0A1G2PCZ8_9BACT|nr:MAG: 30S ribosomal protein S19 [Candidatus Terrybacteria bacterium RIFCSPHIGHO2_01_FULL_43_35]OHA49430.1 MAG: 30S ribosomal protein S19 [Candidatus Terrybacteria bacterium RIFCSPHIGHO2_02_FULL_43_14]OHA51657.1 MAG: 30S ribosomal protein S19 [Candidatus Terrybacteria bacterium RIFCSPLOWO2_01_FULL_44_24]
MSRSLKKGPFADPKLMKKIGLLKRGDRTIIKTWARSSSVTPEMVGFTIGVHNGRIHIPVLIREEMVGHKLGEFSPTRKFVKHGGKLQKEVELQEASKAVAPAPDKTAPAVPAKK